MRTLIFEIYVPQKDTVSTFTNCEQYPLDAWVQYEQGVL